MYIGFIFLMTVWSSFTSGNTVTPLKFLLGCQAVIPCELHTTDSSSFKWVYKKDKGDNGVRIFYQDKSGVKYHQQSSNPRVKVLQNRSLVIDNLTEDDRGIYWCENCLEKDCSSQEHNITIVRKEIQKERNVTVCVTAGGSFTHACASELNDLMWTFQQNVQMYSVQGPSLTPNKSLHIVNVQKGNAGKYTCWETGCDGKTQRLLTINLCVSAVYNGENSSVSCAMMCEMELINIKPNSSSNTDTRTELVNPNGFLNCSANHIHGGYTTINCTDGPANVPNNKTDIPAKAEYLIPVVYGTSVALICLILITFLICCLTRKLQAACPVGFCCCDLDRQVEDDSLVVYSSVIIRRLSKTKNNHSVDSRTDCVYSEIKV